MQWKELAKIIVYLQANKKKALTREPLKKQVLKLMLIDLPSVGQQTTQLRFSVVSTCVVMITPVS